MARYDHSGAAPETTLVGDIVPTSTALTIAAGDGYPTGAGGKKFWLVIDPEVLGKEEKIVVTSRTGTALALASSADRGQDGTVAVSHKSGAKVRHIWSATEADEVNAHVNDPTLDQHTEYQKVLAAGGTFWVTPTGNDVNSGTDIGRGKATFEAARAALVAAGGGRIVFVGTIPFGATTYHHTVDGTIFGIGLTAPIEGVGPDFSLITYNGSGTAIDTGTSTSVPGGAFVARDFAINGAGSTGNARGMYLKRYQQESSLTNVKITGFAYANAHFYRCYGIGLYSCHLTGSTAGWGCLFDNSNGFVAVDTRFSANALGGARVYFNDGTAPNDEAGTAAAAGTFIGPLIEDNVGPGIEVDSASMIDILGGYVEHNNPTGLAQIIVTGGSAATPSYLHSAGVRYSGKGAVGDPVCDRAIYVDFGEVALENNQSFGHDVAFCEVTANGTVNLGSHRNGTRPEGSDGDPVVLIDNSRQTKNALRSSFHGGAGVPFSLTYLLDSPAAGVTNGDVPLLLSPLATDRMPSAGLSWEISFVSARATSPPAVGAHSAVFTADATTDTLTATGHGMANGTAVVVASSGGLNPTLPGGLLPNTIYYVIGATANTFQLSLTSGGAAINITSTGGGTAPVHTFYSSWITFFAKSGATALNAAIEVALSNPAALLGQVGNARSVSAGGVIGLGYSTSAEYSAAAGTKFYVTVHGILKPFAS